MGKRLITVLAALLVLGFVAGCGDDESASDTTQTVTDTVTEDEVVTDTVTDTVTDETATSEGGGAAVPQDVEAAVEGCRRAVTSTPNLSADTKSELEDLCDRAASGNVEDATQARLEVCQKIVEDVYPDGVPGKEQALDACESGVQ